MPFRPKRSDTHDNVDLSNLKLNGSLRSGPDSVALLEAKVNGM
jgi:hypothetical protein